MKKILFRIIVSAVCFAGCNHNDNIESCIITEWDVIDLYRNAYPSITDTLCEGEALTIVERYRVNRTLFDSTFNLLKSNNRSFRLDTTGDFEIIATSVLNTDTIAKLRYLPKGYNVDQQILIWLVKGKGIYLQQESDDKKLYLLKKVTKTNNVVEEPSSVVQAILRDTILFPGPPALKE